MSYIGQIPLPQATEERIERTATAGQTSFTGLTYVNGHVSVYLNGVKLDNADFTATDGTTVTLGTGAAAGDTVSFVSTTQTSALVALPLKDSAGNAVLSESGGVVTLTADEANVGNNALVVDSSGNVLVGTTTALSNRGVIQAKSSVTGGPGQFSASNTNYSSGSYDWSFGMNSAGAFVVYINPGVSGNAGVYLNAGATSWTGNSDERLKDITGEIVDAVSSVCSLRAVKYTFKADEQEIKTQRVGLIAQDVQAVLPEIVDEDPEGYLGIRYAEVAPLLVKAIQEQQALIESQQSQIDALTTRIEALEAT